MNNTEVGFAGACYGQQLEAGVGYSELLPHGSLLPLSSAGCTQVLPYGQLVWSSPVHTSCWELLAGFLQPGARTRHWGRVLG